MLTPIKRDDIMKKNLSGGGIMKILYMGTAAAEGYPALFCVCERCKKARSLGGKNFRSRPQALIDGKLLIDFNADSLYHSKLYNVDYSYIKSLLITHIHEDHFVPVELGFRRRGFAFLQDSEAKLQIYGSKDITAPLEKYNDKGDAYGFNINEVNAFEPFFAEGYKITALKAVHGTENMTPFIYLIEKDGKSLLYAHDTGIFPDETFDYLKKTVKHLSFASLDCTEGTKSIKYVSHMNYERDVFVKNRLLELGVADENTVFCLNHFSHNGENSLYDDMSAIGKKDGFIVSYDGMTVEF